MKPYTHSSNCNSQGYWLTRENNHIIVGEIEEDTSFEAKVHNWTNGDRYTVPRHVIAKMFPVPDYVIANTIRDAGFTANADKLWDLGARMRLDCFTLRHGHVLWSSAETDLQLILPETIVTVDSMRQAVLEQYGADVAIQLLQRASRIAFHNAGREPLELTPPDVKGA